MSFGGRTTTQDDPPPWRARRRERATPPASPSGGVGWGAGGMARSWNGPDASGAQPRAASRRSGGAARKLPRVAQRTEQPPPKRQAAGSSPAAGAISRTRRPFLGDFPQKSAPCLQETPFLINLSHRTGGGSRVSVSAHGAVLSGAHALSPEPSPAPWLRGKRKAPQSAKSAGA